LKNIAFWLVLFLILEFMFSNGPHQSLELLLPERIQAMIRAYTKLRRRERVIWGHFQGSILLEGRYETPS